MRYVTLKLEVRVPGTLENLKAEVVADARHNGDYGMQAKDVTVYDLIGSLYSGTIGIGDEVIEHEEAGEADED
jgi:hypothetical protein